MTMRTLGLLLVVLVCWPGVHAAEWRFGPRVEVEPGAGFAIGAGVMVAYLPFELLPDLRFGVSAHGGASWPVEGIAWTGALTVHAVIDMVYARLGWWGEAGARGDATGPYLAAGATGALDRALDWAIDAAIGLDLFAGETRFRLGVMLLLTR